MGVSQRFYTISQKEIDSIVNMAAGAGADAGIAAYKKAEQKAKESTVNRNLNNTRKLLETYRTLKNDLLHSSYETDQAQEELRFKCVEDLMTPGESKRMDDIMAKEVARMQENAWRKRQIERAVELLKEDCSRPERPEDMRKYRVIMGLYIQDEKMGFEDLAEQEYVTERTIHRDAREACIMITPYLFGIDAIVGDA